MQKVHFSKSYHFKTSFEKVAIFIHFPFDDRANCFQKSNFCVQNLLIYYLFIK